MNRTQLKSAKKNYPQIEQCGDVTKADFTQYEGVDLLIGGSPCTNWSCAKNHTAKVKKELFANEGEGWELFKQYARAIEEAKPKPNDKGIVLKDVYMPDETLVRTDERIIKTAVKKQNYVQYAVNEKHLTSQPFRLYYLNGKAPTIARCCTESKCKILIDENDLSKYKIISPIEAERLQTLPDNYTDGVPKTRRFEAIGNGWTVDVIAHIFKGLLEVQND